MLYTIHSKWVFDKDIVLDYDESMVYGNWVEIANQLTEQEVVDVLHHCNESPFEDDYIQVVTPDLNIGDIVINIKDNKVGQVTHFESGSLEAFNDFLAEDINPIGKILEPVTVITLESGETMNWQMKDLIVINSPTIS